MLTSDWLARQRLFHARRNGHLILANEQALAMVYECMLSEVRSFTPRHLDMHLSTESRAALYAFSIIVVMLTAHHADHSIADIVRILLMVPIYATVSFSSYLFWVRYLVPRRAALSSER